MSGTSPAESKENLTTLAPDIVAAILDETLPPHVTVHELTISPPVVGGATGADWCWWRGNPAGVIGGIPIHTGW